MVATKVKKCTVKIRQGGERVPCGESYSGERCPNKDNHIFKMPTGQCLNGWCEGTKSRDWRDNPVPTCKMIINCPCKCHDSLDKLFAMTESERIIVDSSGYAPPHRTYWMPSDNPLPPLSSNHATSPPVVVESPDSSRVPTTIRPAFGPTPTGRAARGELELWVKEECDAWLIDEPGVPCTPVYLATEIGKSQGITPPSVGAISSVFERWVKLGFAVVEKKPTRFVKYTDEGVRLGLDRMKAEVKKNKKRIRSDMARGFRR